MDIKPWMWAAMEEEGILDTKEGLINRIVKYFEENNYIEIGEREFINACQACRVDPYEFDRHDISIIERRLNKYR